jgi:hypothetical protein
MKIIEIFQLFLVIGEEEPKITRRKDSKRKTNLTNYSVEGDKELSKL